MDANLQLKIDSSQAKTAEQNLKNLEKQSSNTEKGFSNLAKGAVAALTAIGASSVFRSMIQEQEQLQRNMLRTEQLIKSTGATAGFTAKQLQDQARSLALATLQSTEGVMEAQQVLLTFRSVSGDTFTRATELAADLATVTGGSLQGAITQLGKALEDPVQGINAMTRSGVSFTQQQKDLIKELVETNRQAEAQKLILDELAQQYGGVSRKEAEGLAGAQDTLAQALQEAKIALAEQLDAAENLTKALNKVSESVFEFNRALKAGEYNAHIEALKMIGYWVGGATAAYGLYRAAVLASAAAQVIFNRAILRNPLFLVGSVAGIGATVSAMYAFNQELANQIDSLQEAGDAGEGLVITIDNAVGTIESATDAVYNYGTAWQYWHQLNEQTSEFLRDDADLLAEMTSQVDSYGDAWVRTGDKALDALGSMMAMMASQSEQEKKTSELLAKARAQGLKDTEQYRKLEAKRVRESIQGSAQMLGAASAMFREGSREQEIAHKASVAMHAVEMGMQLKEAIGAATVAVATQGKGDPYTAFARVAAMSAMMAGVLSNIGATFGGSGGSGSALPQSGVQLTEGGRFDGEQSQSIANSTQYMLDLNAKQYRELQGINTGVEDLKDAITGTVRGLFMGGDIAALSGSAINTVQASNALGGLVDSVAGGLPLIGGALAGLGSAVFGSTSRKTTDYGLMASGTIDALMVQGFETIKTTSKNLFGSSSKKSTKTRSISAEAQNSIALVFQSLADTMTQVGDQLDRDISSELNSFRFNLGRVSLRGSPAQVTERLQNALSTQADKLANAMFEDIVGAYQKVDEGIFETAMRVAVEKGVTEDILRQTGQQMVGDAIAISQSLVNLAGGMKELRDAADVYFDKFFNEEEKAARNLEMLSAQLESVGLAVPDTRESFRALVEALDITTASGQAAYVALLQASEMADSYYKNLEQAANDAMAALSRSIKARTDALREEQRAINESIRAIEGLQRALQNAFQQIMPTITPKPVSFMQSQASLFGALETARITGELPDQGEIAEHLAMVSKNGTDYYSSFEDYAYDQALNARVIKELEELAGEQLTLEQQAFNALQTQIDQYDAMLVKYQEQIDKLMGIDNSVLSVADAVAKVEAAIRGLTPGVRPPAPAASGPTQLTASALSSILAGAGGLSAKEEAAQIQYWTSIGVANLSGQALIEKVKDLARIDLESTSTGFSASQLKPMIDELNRLDGSHFNGLSYVPFDGYRAELHRGEAVVTAREANIFRGGEIVLELQALRNEVSELRKQDHTIGLSLIRNTADTAEYLEEMAVN